MQVSKNTRVVLSLVAAFLAMGGLAFASVPLYRAFCSATGFAGTARRALVAPKVASSKIVQVHFDANTNGLPWKFTPDQPTQMARVGKTAMMYFTVKNEGNVPITGRAAYNILPDTMGQFFMKLQCFCFQNQTLAPGESRHFPVVYFLDPHLLTNTDTKDLTDVTLSYTFFEVKEAATLAKSTN